MGTRWSLKFRAPGIFSDTAVLECVRKALGTVVAQMSTWVPRSDISAFNGSGAGSLFTLASAFSHVVERALHWARETGGAFDPTVGPLVDAWGFGPREDPHDHADSHPPAECDRTAAQAALGWRRLGFDPATRTLVQPGGVRLDLSGIAKGYAVDLASDALRALGVHDFLLEIGGELRAHGRRLGGNPWVVGIEQGEGSAPLPLPLRDGAIATSGDRWHRFDHQGRRYSHTVDPRTGAPVAHGLASVTVLHPHCIDADALATALLVMGPEQGPEFARLRGIAACFVRRSAEGTCGWLSPAFERLL